ATTERTVSASARWPAALSTTRAARPRRRAAHGSRSPRCRGRARVDRALVAPPLAGRRCAALKRQVGELDEAATGKLYLQVPQAGRNWLARRRALPDVGGVGTRSRRSYRQRARRRRGRTSRPASASASRPGAAPPEEAQPAQPWPRPETRRLAGRT